MISLYEDPCFTFHFADDRMIPRFHLDGVPTGCDVLIYMMDAVTGESRTLLATATVGEGGWVDLAAPILVRAGDTFVAVTSNCR